MKIQNSWKHLLDFIHFHIITKGKGSNKYKEHFRQRSKEQIYSFSVLYIMNKNSSDSRDVYLHHRCRLIFVFSSASPEQWGGADVSWAVPPGERSRLTEDGGGALLMEPHQSHRWPTGVYCEAHYRALNSPCGTMRGPGARGRARGCSGLIWRPRGAHSGLSRPDVHPQLPASIFLCFCQHVLYWYHLKSAHFFFTTAELCLKVSSALSTRTCLLQQLALAVITLLFLWCFNLFETYLQ